MSLLLIKAWNIYCYHHFGKRTGLKLTDTDEFAQKWTLVFSTRRWAILVARMRRKKEKKILASTLVQIRLLTSFESQLVSLKFGPYLSPESLRAKLGRSLSTSFSSIRFTWIRFSAGVKKKCFFRPDNRKFSRFARTKWDDNEVSF